MEILVIALAVVVAGAIGALGPQAIAPLPEPADDGYDKTPYADLALRRDARWVMGGTAAVAAGIAAWRLDEPALVPVWVGVAGLGSWMAYVDWHTRYLPRVLNVMLHALTWALVGLAALLLQDPHVLLRAAVANVVFYGIYRVWYWAGRRFFRGGAGFGDVRLSGVLGTALGAVGTQAALIGFYLGFLIGAAFALLAAARVLRNVDGREFPLGPAMLLGALLGVVWGGPVG